MIRSLAVTVVGGAVLFGTVFIVAYRDHHTDAVKAVPAADLDQSITSARRDLPGIVTPSSVPAGWTVTSVRYSRLDPNDLSGPVVLHIGYVIQGKAGRSYVDLESGPDITASLDIFDGSHPVATGRTVHGLRELKADDGTLTLRSADGVSPAVGITGNRDAALEETLASVLG